MLIAAVKNRADRLQRSALPAQNAQFGATPTITGAARREVPIGGSRAVILTSDHHADPRTV
jgi:hypothetical protein